MISAFNTSNNHLQRNKHTDQRIWRENQTKQKTAILLQMVFFLLFIKKTVVQLVWISVEKDDF